MRTLRLLLFVVSIVALGAWSGCSRGEGAGTADTRSDDTGKVWLQAVTAAELGIETVRYSIQAPDQEPIEGSLTIGDGGSVSALEEVPAAKGVIIALRATGPDGIACSGEGTVNVVAGETVSVSIVLQCTLGDGAPGATGTIDVRAEFNICPQLNEVSAEPGEGGFTVSASAQDQDSEVGDVTFAWTAASGSFEDAAAAATSYTCAESGPQRLTAKVTDANGCSHSQDVEVTCAEVPAAPACGDGTVDEGEACDDGNTTAGDGCSDVCTTEQTEPSGRLLCVAEPADACEACTCAQCAAEMTACKELEGVAAAGPRAGTAKSELCQAVVSCGHEYGCEAELCFVYNTPCVPATCAAAEVDCTDVESAFAAQVGGAIQERGLDPSYALGAAYAVSECRFASCLDACGSPVPDAREVVP